MDKINAINPESLFKGGKSLLTTRNTSKDV
jgi:hypothetical protein